MSSTWSPESHFRSLTTEIATFPEIATLGFTCVDFLPKCIDDGEGFVFSTPKYESFRTLVDRVNNWLRSNPKYELKTCESVQFVAKKTAVKTQANAENMCFFEGMFSTRFIIGLRIWTSEFQDEGKEQKIGYFNLVPQQIKEGGLFSSPTFETLNDVLGRFNNSIQLSPIPGRIINVGMHGMKISQSKDDDPDRSSWIEYHSPRNRLLVVIRVFFDIADGIPEEMGTLGIEDFIPVKTKDTRFWVPSKYEPFSSVVNKASNWCISQKGIRICNFKSYDIEGHVDTQKMSYVRADDDSTYFVRVLRVFYFKPRTSLQDNFAMPEITCKTGTPLQLKRSCANLGNLEETKKRVQAWVKATGVEVINAETAVIRYYPNEDLKLRSEDNYAVVTEDSHYRMFIFIIRLYINGTYSEPPPEILTPDPALPDMKCCVPS